MAEDFCFLPVSHRRQSQKGEVNQLGNKTSSYSETNPDNMWEWRLTLINTEGKAKLLILMHQLYHQIFPFFMGISVKLTNLTACHGAVWKASLQLRLDPEERVDVAMQVRNKYTGHPSNQGSLIPCQCLKDAHSCLTRPGTLVLQECASMTNYIMGLKRSATV